MSKRRYTARFAELRLADREDVGGKCASLGELVAAGLPVPDGFAVTVRAFEDFRDASELRQDLAAIVTSTQGQGAAELQKVYERATRLILERPLPAEIEDAVRGAYQRLSADVAAARGTDAGMGIAVAVRSSAVDEDGDQASFAGQQDTFLWVVGADEVVQKVRECWASLYTPQAMAYRSGVAAADGYAASCMSVAVQAMAEADVAGVTFTVSPTTGDRSVVAINASYGLGQAIVSGEVTPDEYRISKVEGRILESRIAEKAHEYVPADDQRGVVFRAVDAERRAAPALTEEEIARLVEIGLRVEEHYGCPQDIEWALERRADGPARIMLLQSRPETNWKKRKMENAAATRGGANLLGFLAGVTGKAKP